MRISVIIPIFKRIELLDRCIKTCKASSLSPYEIIVVDDGNTADDAAQIKEIVKRNDARLVVLSKNSGACAARNAGIDVATGDAYFFADADITVEPHAFEELARALEHDPHAWYAYGDTNFGTHRLYARPYDVIALRTHNYIASMSLVRAGNDVRFDETLRRFQDWDLWLGIASRGGYGVYVNELICTATPGGTISTWIPSFLVYHASWFQWIPRVRAYTKARRIIEAKYGLTRQA